MKRVAVYRLNGKVVNKASFYGTIYAKIFLAVLAVLALAAVSPLTLAESFGYAGVLVLAAWARTIELEIADG